MAVILQVPFLGNLETDIVIRTKEISIGLSIAFIVFYHVTVYRETRRHEQQLAAQHVTQEAREQFENNKKAFKMTFIVIAVLVLCYLLLIVCLIVASSYRSEFKTPEAIFIFLFFAIWILLLNSLINPIVYSIRMRQFRVAFIELICRTVNIAEAEEIEMRIFGAQNAVVALEAVQEHEGDQQDTDQANVNIVRAEEIEMRSFGAPNTVVLFEAVQDLELEGQDQKNMEQANVNNSVYDNHNNDVLPQHENYVVEQPNNNNSYCYCVHYRHSI